MTELVIPFASGRYTPEEPVRHRAHAVRRRLNALGLDRFGSDADTLTDLICRTSPQAGPDTIGLVADWLLWVFPLDDLCEHVFRHRAAGEPVSLLTAGALPQIVTTGMIDLCAALAARMSPGWNRQFAGHLDSYLRHAIQHAGPADPGDLPPPAEFLALRREEGAARPTIDLVEVAAGADLPAQFRAGPAWRRLSEACADVLTWTNDIYSYRKERHAGSRFNLIDVLIQHLCRSEREARDRAADMTNRMARRFDDLAGGLENDPAFLALTPDDRSAALRCVTGMKYWMRGQYDWFTTTRPARYRVLEPR